MINELKFKRLRNMVQFLRRGIDLVYRDSMARLAAYLLPQRVMRMGKYFRLWEKHGYHVLPVHFYTPIPTTDEITESVLQHKSDLIDIDLNTESQLGLLRLFQSQYKTVYDKFPMNRTETPHEYYKNNVYFSVVDASILYAMVRHFKPSQIIEVGSGFSTYVSAQAVRDNRIEGVDTRLVAIEPYPVKTLQDGFDGLNELIVCPIQSVPMSRFEALGPNDILFIDSSHVVKIGSDVQRLCLEILPRLKPGVIVHVHDIFLPYEYPREWVLDNHRFWNEQYLFQAFLSGRRDFEVLFATHYILKDHAALANSVWHENSTEHYFDVDPERSHFRPSASFWFRRKLPL